MSKNITVVITEDPRTTPRPVEALRIALGLCAGDHNTSVILLGQAPLLLTDDTDDIEDVDILEKYRPSFAHLEIPFFISSSSPIHKVRSEFAARVVSDPEIRSHVQSAERTLVF